MVKDGYKSPCEHVFTVIFVIAGLLYLEQVGVAPISGGVACQTHTPPEPGSPHHGTRSVNPNHECASMQGRVGGHPEPPSGDICTALMAPTHSLHGFLMIHHSGAVL